MPLPFGRLFSRVRGSRGRGPARAHVVVSIDPARGAYAIDVRSPFTEGEARPVLSALLSAVAEHTSDARSARVSTWIREIQAELGVLDKLRHKGRWEAEARNVVPKERFSGQAGRGLVEVELDGNLGFIDVRISGEASAHSLAALAQEAATEAEAAARARWGECLRGALEALPDDDKVELGIAVAGGPEQAAEVDDQGQTEV